MRDVRLSATDHRVLEAICGHARFGRNGRHCTASASRLAKLTGAHVKAVERSRRRLVEFGYVETIPSPHDRRRKSYAATYTAADRYAFKTDHEQEESPQVIGNKSAPYNGNDSAPYPHDATTEGNKSAPQSTEIGNSVFQKTSQYQEDANHKRLSETCLRDSVETARAGARDPISTVRTIYEAMSEHAALHAKQAQQEEAPIRSKPETPHPAPAPNKAERKIEGLRTQVMKKLLDIKHRTIAVDLIERVEPSAWQAWAEAVERDETNPESIAAEIAAQQGDEDHAQHIG